MNFNDYLNNAWATHATNAKQVAEDFKANFSLMETEDDVMAMTNLIVHVCGEHLGEWERGSELLKKIKNNAKISDKSAMNRYVAILNLGNNPNTSIEDFSASDQVRIYSPVASALASLGGLKNAEKLLNKASEICAQLPKEDPANKALAMAGNNIASKLEEKTTRSEHEVKLMITAASLARKYWEIAGTWKEVERAEYRLAQTYLKANEMDKALVHAEECLEIVSNNGNDPLEEFFAYEALTLVHKELKNQIGFDSALHGMKITFDKLSEADQSWCKETLEKLSK
jgi:tetratricopeptide (TPR) repeat protein